VNATATRAITPIITAALVIVLGIAVALAASSLLAGRFGGAGAADRTPAGLAIDGFSTQDYANLHLPQGFSTQDYANLHSAPAAPQGFSTEDYPS
jgi:hypothetical protein